MHRRSSTSTPQQQGPSASAGADAADLAELAELMSELMLHGRHDEALVRCLEALELLPHAACTGRQCVCYPLVLAAVQLYGETGRLEEGLCFVQDWYNTPVASAAAAAAAQAATSPAPPPTVAALVARACVCLGSAEARPALLETAKNLVEHALAVGPVRSGNPRTDASEYQALWRVHLLEVLPALGQNTNNARALVQHSPHLSARESADLCALLEEDAAGRDGDECADRSFSNSIDHDDVVVNGLEGARAPPPASFKDLPVQEIDPRGPPPPVPPQSAHERVQAAVADVFSRASSWLKRAWENPAALMEQFGRGDAPGLAVVALAGLLVVWLAWRLRLPSLVPSLWAQLLGELRSSASIASGRLV